MKYIFLRSSIFYFVGQIKKSVLQKEIKDLSFEVTNPSTSLQFLLFLNNRSTVHYCELGWVVCGGHNCLILNIET